MFAYEFSLLWMQFFLYFLCQILDKLKPRSVLDFYYWKFPVFLWSEVHIIRPQTHTARQPAHTDTTIRWKCSHHFFSSDSMFLHQKHYSEMHYTTLKFPIRYNAQYTLQETLQYTTLHFTIKHTTPNRELTLHYTAQLTTFNCSVYVVQVSVNDNQSLALWPGCFS